MWDVYTITENFNSWKYTYTSFETLLLIVFPSKWMCSINFAERIMWAWERKYLLNSTSILTIQYYFWEYEMWKFWMRMLISNSNIFRHSLQMLQYKFVRYKRNSTVDFSRRDSYRMNINQRLCVKTLNWHSQIHPRYILRKPTFEIRRTKTTETKLLNW